MQLRRSLHILVMLDSSLFYPRSLVPLVVNTILGLKTASYILSYQLFCIVKTSEPHNMLLHKDHLKIQYYDNIILKINSQLMKTAKQIFVWLKIVFKNPFIRTHQK